jgi:hypothetical protein
MIHNIAFRANWDKIQKENRTLSISPIKKKARPIVEFVMNIRLEAKCY